MDRDVNSTPDMAPDTLSTTVATTLPAKRPDNAALMGVPPAQKRKKTSGEIAFDITTYGGLSLAANEFLSTAIMEQTDKGGILHKLYKPMEDASRKLPGLSKLDYVGKGRAMYILWATIGGMMLVLPVKWMEDHKGKVVRLFDNLLHGRDTSQDPKLDAAHREMDQAPKQSWASLWQGRAVTVASALGLDSLVGWKHSAITKLFDKPGKPNDIASFDRMSATFARWIVPKFAPQHAAGIQEVLNTVTDVEKRYAINVAKEGQITKTVTTGSMLMVLSGALTALFYVSSKAFARRQELKQSKPHAKPAPYADTVLADTAVEPTPEPAPHRPTPQIAKVEHLDRVSDAPQLQAGV